MTRCRRGARTSECWMSIACLLCGVLLIWTDDEAIGASLVGVATGGYVASRTFAKRHDDGTTTHTG